MDFSYNISSCIPIFFSNNCQNIFDFNDFLEENGKFSLYQMNLLKTTYLLRESLQIGNQIKEEKLCSDFIALSEGCSLVPYYCSEGILTIGYGLALRSKDNAPTHLAKKAFSFIGLDLIQYLKNFDSYGAKDTRLQITNTQAIQLLSYIVLLHSEDLSRYFYFFKKLPINIKVVIHSLYYHNPIFIKGEFNELLHLFYSTNDDYYLAQLLYVVCRKSNYGAPYLLEDKSKRAVKTSYWKGVQYRRYREMVMLSNNNLDRQFFSPMLLYFCK